MSKNGGAYFPRGYLVVLALAFSCINSLIFDSLHLMGDNHKITAYGTNYIIGKAEW